MNTSPDLFASYEREFFRLGWEWPERKGEGGADEDGCQKKGLEDTVSKEGFQAWFGLVFGALQGDIHGGQRSASSVILRCYAQLPSALSFETRNLTGT